MPPKGTKKKVEEPTKTPQKTKVEAKVAATSVKTPKQTARKGSPTMATPKKTKEPAKVTKLVRDKTATLPVTVTFQGDNAEAKHTSKVGYTHALKLDATGPFTLLDSYVIPEGQPHEGFQVILIKPAQAFKFLKLTPEIRKRIYTFYFFAKGQGSLPITFDGKRKNDAKDPYSKMFAEGSKNRVGLLAVNKEINEEATPVLYSRPLRFDSPSILMAFFADLEAPLRMHLRHIEINTYVKKDAKTALAFLAEAKKLNHLRIDLGMAMDDDVDKVARAFWLDASKLLEAVASIKEKKKNVIDRPRQQVANPKDEDSSDEESSEDEDGESSEEDEEEDAGDEETEDPKETKETKETTEVKKVDEVKETAEVEETTPSVDQSDVAKETTVNPAHLELSSTVEQMDISEGAPAALKTEDTIMGDNDDNSNSDVKPNDTVKKDSKSPVPVVAATKKVATPDPGPPTRHGRRSDAIDILHFGKSAFKYKDEDQKEHDWDSSMRAEFMDALRAKLSFLHLLPVWGCICGNRVFGHNCTIELARQREAKVRVCHELD